MPKTREIPFLSLDSSVGNYCGLLPAHREAPYELSQCLRDQIRANLAQIEAELLLLRGYF